MTDDRIERAAIALAHDNWEACKRHAKATGQDWSISFENFWKKNAGIARATARTVLDAADRAAI